MVRLLALFLISAVAPLIPGCEPVETDPEEPIETSPGETFTIVIASNPTTPYEWRLAEPLDEDVVRLLGRDYVPDRPVSTGSGGWDEWSFKALAPGETRVVLGNFELTEEAPPIETLTFTVEVR